MLFKSTEDYTCKACSAVNVVSFTDYPEKDRYSVDCAGSGEVLLSGKGTRDHHTAVLKERSNGLDDRA